jgi:hypothetical protein
MITHLHILIFTWLSLSKVNCFMSHARIILLPQSDPEHLFACTSMLQFTLLPKNGKLLDYFSF